MWERTEGGQDGQLWGPRSLSSVTRAQTHHMPARDPLEVLQESLNRSHLEFSFLAQLWVQRVKTRCHQSQQISCGPRYARQWWLGIISLDAMSGLGTVQRCHNPVVTPPLHGGLPPLGSWSLYIHM